MGVDVVLMRVTQDGTSPKRRRRSPLAMVADEGDDLAQAFTQSGMPMLSRVYPYKDLILTAAEMEQFMQEAESLIAGADVTCAARLRQVLGLARRCRNEPGTELHLQGD